MRSLFLLLPVVIITAVSCKKNHEPGSSSSLALKTCSQSVYGSDLVKICFDSLLEDSRCPRGAICIWMGTATGKFSFTVNNNEQKITLSTVVSPALFPRDTILMGYKIEFLDLLPYPDINAPGIRDYKADIKITKQ